MVTIAAAGLVGGAILSGKIVEWLGARRTMLIAIVAYGGFGSGGLFLQQAWTLLASRILVGFSTACMITACISTIGAVYEGNDRAKMIGASAGMGQVMGLVGLIAGGALAQAFGWRMAFIQYPMFGVAGLILVGLGDAPKPAAIAPVAHSAGALTLWPIYTLAAVLMMVMLLGSVQFPFLLPQDGIKSITVISWILGSITAVAMVTSFAYGVIEKRLGLHGTLVAGLAVNAAGLVLIGVVVTPLAAGIGAGLSGVYVGLVAPYLHHIVVHRAALSFRARAIGLLNACSFTGAFANPFVFGPISSHFGLHGLFLILGLGMAALAVGSLLMPRSETSGSASVPP
jgi:MFS family permease